MRIRELNIADSFEVTPLQREDDRGVFMETYRFDLLSEAVGHPISLRQVNTSVSRRGVVRGIHFADFPRGQAKYVTASAGAVLDFIIDIRVGSPTFGQWDSVLLDTAERRSVYIAEGLGHAFVALTEGAAVTYLVSDTYNPSAEHAVDPRDPQVGLAFPDDIGELLISQKDAAAPTLAEAAAMGLLPTWEAARDYYRTLDAEVAR